MSEKYKELMIYALRSYYSSIEEKHEGTLNVITDMLIEIAHDNGWVEEVTHVLEEAFNE